MPAHYALVTIHKEPCEKIRAGYVLLTEGLSSPGYAVTGPPARSGRSVATAAQRRSTS